MWIQDQFFHFSNKEMNVEKRFAGVGTIDYILGLMDTTLDPQYSINFLIFSKL